MNENRLYRHIFNELKPSVQHQLISELCDLEQPTVLNLTEEETKLIRQRLGVYGIERSYYKNMVTDELSISKLNTKFMHIERKMIKEMKDYAIEADIKSKKITSLKDYDMNELQKIFGSDASAVREYAHKNGIYLKDETKEDIMPISTLQLNPRSENCLMRKDVTTVGRLLKLTEADIKNMKGVGIQAQKDITSKLSQAGYHLSTEQKEQKPAKTRLTK